IKGNAMMLAGEATIDGVIEKDVTAYSARSLGWGPFSRSVFSRGGEIQVLAHARVGRNLFLKVDEQEKAVIDSAAGIRGQTDVRVTPVAPSRYATLSFYVWQTIWFAGAFLAGLVLFRLFPAVARVRLDTGRDLILTGGAGFIAAIAVPVAAVIACLTLIGLPL